ncbi:MAG: Carboxypeptidase regulatory-like domain [Chthonomonadaceae bacterium]|nr:Carboxypeptidase regulatory-like domain [Chthonomonadaceae bacterium]
MVDSSGKGVAGAHVFANVGPIPVPEGKPDQLFFANLASFQTTTRSDGGFTLSSLPVDKPYTVTASLHGYINQTIDKIEVSVSSSTTVTLTLAPSTGTSTVPIPGNLYASSFTAPLNPTRAAGTAGSSTGFLNVVRRIILQQHGLLGHRAAAAQKITLHRSITRDTPAGSLIETDLFWDYAQVNNLYGYRIIRAFGGPPLDGGQPSPGSFNPIATVRDPLADRFADNDAVLTPDNFYYYSIAELDTITGVEGTPVIPAVTVYPLNVLTLVSPASGSVTSAMPTFTWNAVNRVANYLVLVYDQFPTLQTDANSTHKDPNSVPTFWSAVFTGTTGTYVGPPALISGHTYYWAVLGQDSAQSAATISPLQTFIAP